ncbi:MAG: TPM domain-containing protein [Clostridia bacterium]|nr:TPM domain-containing protein [Clostridia bacterium]
MKERKGLHPAIAFVLMILMVCAALFNGAHRHWQEEKAVLLKETQALEAAMNLRAETAQNLLSIARRHLAPEHALCQSVASERAKIGNAALPMAERTAALAQWTQDAKTLLQELALLPSLQQDSRDQMYVQLMLPQAVEQCEENVTFTAYDQAAEKYNTGLGGSFRGVLAHLIGYEKAPRLDSMQPALPVDGAQIAYPLQRGYINDDAAVLGSETIDDVHELNNRQDSAEFVIVTRHFLGGADAQEYCKGLFDHWQLDEDDVLLLLVIGEERYAVCLGGIISDYVSDEQLMSLMGTHLRAPFINERDYDGAVGDFLLALGGHIARMSGEEMDFGGLFGTEETAPDLLFDNWSGNWWEGFFAENDYEEGPIPVDMVYEAYEVDYSSLLVLAVILFAIIRSRRRKRMGGLGFFGWMILIAIISQIGEWLGFLL